SIRLLGHCQVLRYQASVLDLSIDAREGGATMRVPLSPGSLARFSAGHPWMVIAVWLLLSVAAAVVVPSLGDSLTTGVDLLDDSDSVRGENLLEQRLRGPRPVIETVIVRTARLTVDAPEFRAMVERLTTTLLALHGDVADATNVYRSGDQGLV